MMITRNFKDAANSENKRFDADMNEMLISLSALEEQTRKIVADYPDNCLSDVKRRQMLAGVRDLNRLYERHFQSIRGNLIDYYNLLIARGLMDNERQELELSAKISLSYDEGILQISLGALLPFKPKGSVHYISKTLNAAVERFLHTSGLEMHFHRAAVVFIHHYCSLTLESGRTRDYDNLERSCVMNILQNHLLHDDDGAHLITTDLSNPSNCDHTDIFIMEATDYLEFLTKRDFSLYL